MKIVILTVFIFNFLNSSHKTPRTKPIDIPLTNKRHQKLTEEETKKIIAALQESMKRIIVIEDNKNKEDDKNTDQDKDKDKDKK